MKARDFNSATTLTALLHIYHQASILSSKDGNSEMDDILTAVKTIDNRQESDISISRDGNLSPSENETPCGAAIEKRDISSPESILGILKSSPGHSQVVEVLNFLDPSRTSENAFNITVPSPMAAQILHVLISTTIPDHWSSLGLEDDESPSDRGLKSKPKAVLLRCLSSVAGIGAVMIHIRTLLPQPNSSTKLNKRASG